MTYLILDLEATCWKGFVPASRQELIEMGVVKLSTYGKYIDAFQRFVKPWEFPELSPFCKELTGISQDQVNRAQPFDAVYLDFIEWLALEPQDYLICAWGDKDKELLLAECKTYRLDESIFGPYMDLKSAYHRIKGLTRRQGLVKTLEKEGISFEGDHHRALDDAKNLGNLFVKYLDDWQV